MIADAFLNELDARWDMSDPAGSEQRLRELAAQRREPLERHVLEVEVARAQGLQGDFARATLVPLLAELEAAGAPAGDVLRELRECELAGSGSAP